jgi:dTMP kinase
VSSTVSGSSGSVSDTASDQEETTTLPRFADADAELPISADEREAEETAVLPQYSPADDTAVLPQVRDDSAADGRRGDRAGERFPEGFFRDEVGPGARGTAAGAESGNERTREIPQFRPADEATGPQTSGGQDAAGGSRSGTRRRSDWAEETPLDDLPTLADELLGTHDEDDDDTGTGGGRRGGRRR